MMPLILLGGAAAAAMYYQKSKQLKNPPLTTKTQSYQPAQPSLLYPWRATQPPRVDNADQPWYTGPRNFTATPPDNMVSTIVTSAKAGSSVVQSMGDIWGNLQDFFGGGSGGTVGTTDNIPTNSPDLPASDSGASAGYDVGTDQASAGFNLGVDTSIPGSDGFSV